MKGVRVLLVDDHPVVRAGIRALLGAADAVDVVGEAASGEEALAVAARVQPDLVLMDLRLGAGMDGVEATTALRRAVPAPYVLVLTTYDNDGDILRAVEAGAAGYLLKDTPADQLVEAVRRAAAGETVLAPVVQQRLVDRLKHPTVELSVRELEVLGKVVAGLSNREVARALFISEATVKSHLVHVFGKLGVESRTAAVAAARDAGLIV